jgi:hypothetical protein
MVYVPKVLARIPEDDRSPSTAVEQFILFLLIVGLLFFSCTFDFEETRPERSEFICSSPISLSNSQVSTDDSRCCAGE